MWTMRSCNRRKCTVTAIIITAVMYSSQGVCQENVVKADIEKILPSVVRLHVAGESDNGVIDRYGTGILVGQDGLILTAFHTVGVDDVGKKIIWKNVQGNPRIEVETYSVHGILLKLPVNASIYGGKVEPDLDVAILKIDGHSYETPDCTFLKLDEQSPLWGVGWRQGITTYDLLKGQVAPASAQDGARYRLVNMSAFKGNSGGPVFDSKGTLVGIITSGRDGRLIPGSPETFATPLYLFWQLFPPFGKCSPLRTVTYLEESPGSIASAVKDVVGSYTVVGTVPQVERVTNNRVEPFEFRNEHCEGPREISQPIQAMAGWKIDPASIKPAHGKSSMSSFTGITELTDTGFAIRARVANNGVCLQPFAVDGRGSVWGRVSWTEYKDIEKGEPAEIARGLLTRNQSVPVDLPPGTKNIEVIFTDEKNNKDTATPGKQTSHISVSSINKGKIIIAPK